MLSASYCANTYVTVPVALVPDVRQRGFAPITTAVETTSAQTAG